MDKNGLRFSFVLRHFLKLYHLHFESTAMIRLVVDFFRNHVLKLHFV